MFFFLAFYMFLLVHSLRLVVLILVELLRNIIENSATLLRVKDRSTRKVEKLLFEKSYIK